MLNLRPAGPEDEPLLHALFAEDKQAELAGAGMPAALVQTLVEMQYRGRQTTYTARYPESEDSILLGDFDEPVGRLLLHRKPGCWRIVDIAVLAAHRGRGLGTRALEDCQRRAAAVGASLELHVERQNPAQRLYRRQGFQIASEDAIGLEMVWRS
jgi:ribosomal protein S18 acetylase RimI-like enzyme